MERHTANFIFSAALEFISCTLNELIKVLLIGIKEGCGRGIHEVKDLVGGPGGRLRFATFGSRSDG